MGDGQSWRWYALESLVVFVVGVMLMSFIYAGERNRPVDERGVPGHDSFYHIKMAAMIPEYGLVDEFPWLRFVYFTDAGHAFVEHHYGFHTLLIPFVRLSHWLTGDYLPGGRWAITMTFGLTLVLFNLLLIAERIRWRWLWLMLFLLLPFQFFTRHAYVRAISPSLLFMLLILLLMFRRRFVLTGLAVAGYTHLYLGGVLYAPLLLGFYVVSCLMGPRDERVVPWRLIICGVTGWLVGVLIHPYSNGMWEFLKLQVFGSGLSPDIAVGREWKPYKDVWWFAQMSGTVLIVWALALSARLQLGKPLNTKEFTLLLVNFTFLALTFKARRFIEYWPVFCLLNAAFMAAPVMDGAQRWLERVRSKRHFQTPWLELAAVLPIATGLVALAYRIRHWTSLEPFVAEWKTWAALAAVYVLVTRFVRRRTRAGPARSLAGRCAGVLRVLAVGAACMGATVCFVAYPWSEVQRKARCGYDLPAIRAAMAFLKEHSQPGDVIFTDDWDIFPVYFYYNSYNHYIVGLDPKFTHARRPDLWERYVKVSRGQVPADVTVKIPDRSGRTVKTRLHVQLEDIRDHFGAHFVITDRDHKPLAAKLARAQSFAELIYPSGSYETSRDAPYLVFRIGAQTNAP